METFSGLFVSMFCWLILASVATALNQHTTTTQELNNIEDGKLLFANVVSLRFELELRAAFHLLISIKYSLKKLYRHGDRTPIDPYPNDPWKNNSLWPTGWGQLTTVSYL